jgi:hypothetical protein
MTSAHKRWTADHQHLLLRERMQAGVSDATFARDNTIGLRQLQQLERGGSSAFYSEDIKYDTGLKLLRRLNASASVVSSMEPSETQQAPLPSVATLRKDALPYLVPEGRADRLLSPPAITAFVRSGPRVWLLLGLGLLGMGLLMTLWPAGTDERLPTPATARVPVSGEGATAETVPAAVSPQAGGPDREVPTESTGLPGGSSCGLSPDAPTVSPDRPSKAADYVYLVASDEVVICVQDASGRMTHMKLAAGRNANIPGRAPFYVTAEPMLHLQVFFQGQRLAWTPGLAGLRLQPRDTRD